MDRNELSRQFRQLLESTVIPDDELAMPDGIGKHKFLTIENFVRPHIQKRLFRYRRVDPYSIISFEHNTITLCSADLFSDRFDSVVHVDKNRLNEDTKRGFDWDMQQWIIEEVRTTGHLPEVMIRTYGSENAEKMASVYKAKTDEEMRQLWEEGQKFLDMFLENIPKLSEQIVTGIRKDEEFKIACFTEDIGSTYMWDKYADGYKGFALEYDLTGAIGADFSEPLNERVYPYLYPIIYSDAKYDATDIASWLFNNAFYGPQGFASFPCPDTLFKYKALLYKDARYSHEREWRLMGSCEKMKGEKAMEVTSGTKMKAIYYGPYMDKVIKNHLREWAKIHGIKEYEVGLDDNSRGFDLVIEPL